MDSENIDLDQLFRRISSPQTQKGFKTLRHATSEDLANSFQPDPRQTARK